MAKKSKPNSQANLLRGQGVPALRATVDFPHDINPIGFYSPNKDKYRQIWTNYDLQQFCSSLVFKNLPNGLQSWQVLRMLYFRGTLCGFKYAGKVYILPYYIQGQLNPYGMPTYIRPLTYNGNQGRAQFLKGYALPVDYDGNLINENGNKIEERAFLLYDSVPPSPGMQSQSRYLLNQIIINEIADTLARVNINVVVSNKKILLQIPDANQADIVKMELTSAFNSDCPFAVISSPLDANAIQSTSDFNADELFNTVKNWDAIRCFMSGIASKNFGTEKKERLVSGELAGNEEQIGLILDQRYELAKLFADQMNNAFDLNITVEKRAGSYTDSVNGNGNDKLDEEDEL